MKWLPLIFVLLVLSSVVIAAEGTAKYEAIEADLADEARALQQQDTQAITRMVVFVLLTLAVILQWWYDKSKH